MYIYKLEMGVVGEAGDIMNLEIHPFDVDGNSLPVMEFFEMQTQTARELTLCPQVDYGQVHSCALVCRKNSMQDTLPAWTVERLHVREVRGSFHRDSYYKQPLPLHVHASLDIMSLTLRPVATHIKPTT
jgi:hypothetical protein